MAAFYVIRGRDGVARLTHEWRSVELIARSEIQPLGPTCTVWAGALFVLSDLACVLRTAFPFITKGTICTTGKLSGHSGPCPDLPLSGRECT